MSVFACVFVSKSLESAQLLYFWILTEQYFKLNKKYPARWRLIWDFKISAPYTEFRCNFQDIVFGKRTDSAYVLIVKDENEVIWQTTIVLLRRTVETRSLLFLVHVYSLPPLVPFCSSLSAPLFYAELHLVWYYCIPRLCVSWSSWCIVNIDVLIYFASLHKVSV